MVLKETDVSDVKSITKYLRQTINMQTTPDSYCKGQQALIPSSCQLGLWPSPLEIGQ